jgi:hypothetical protein
LRPTPLQFIVRAISSRRFDARFFAVDASAIAHRVEGKLGPDLPSPFYRRSCNSSPEPRFS